jgi:hypothetical protein
MRVSVWLVGLAALVVGCSSPPAPVQPAAKPAVPTAEAEAPAVEGAAGGSGEENLSPNQLTGLPGIDRAQDLDIRILDARGTGRLGGSPIPAGQVTALPPGQWMLTEADSEYEITLRSGLLPDGIVRLSGLGAFLVEPPLEGALPRFRLFGGQASFYLPHVAMGELTVLTPAGPLVTRGAVFSVTVSPDFQVLVTCREGAVYLTGTQNAVARPGQVLVADRLGRGRVYVMTPNEALVFADRWLKVMAEEAAPVVAATLPRRLAEWRTADSRWRVEDARFTALWFRQARSVLGNAVPAPALWSWPLEGTLQTSVWQELPAAPGLLGELP